jgi:DNA polymerase III alpha subunit
MKIDEFGQAHRTAEELWQLLYTNPQLDLHEVKVDNPKQFNNSIKELFYDHKPLSQYVALSIPIAEFDNENQAQWFMPDKYKEMDIAKWVLDQCKTDAELQRCGQELIMFEDRGLTVVLKFMKYFVDTMREHNVVWGVGRGSSVASYVLFLIGVHKIDSLFYDLDIGEFLK